MLEIKQEEQQAGWREGKHEEAHMNTLLNKVFLPVLQGLISAVLLTKFCRTRWERSECGKDNLSARLIPVVGNI